MLADALDVEEADILKAVNQYTDALLLLDQYDHQVVPRPEEKDIMVALVMNFLTL